jgi:hypothetical protein
MLRSRRGFALPGVPICLGRLESSDFALLSPERKDAVQAFWTAYFNENDHRPELNFGRTGILPGGEVCFNGHTHAATD